MSRASSTMTRYRFFDQSDLESRFRGNSVGAVIQIYLDESPAIIREFIKAGRPPVDSKTLSDWAHSLKGSLDMLCAQHLGQLAGELQNLFHRGESEELSPVFDELVIGLRGLRLELEAYLVELESGPSQ